MRGWIRGNAAESFYTNSSARQCSRFGAEASSWGRFIGEPLLERQEIQPIPQEESQATYAPLIQKQDYSLDWSKPAIALHNQVRGFFPTVRLPFEASC